MRPLLARIGLAAAVAATCLAVRAGAQDTPLPPLVAFSHGSSGWTANISFADPVTEIQWSLDGSTMSRPQHCVHRIRLWLW